MDPAPQAPKPHSTLKSWLITDNSAGAGPCEGLSSRQKGRGRQTSRPGQPCNPYRVTSLIKQLTLLGPCQSLCLGSWGCFPMSVFLWARYPCTGAGPCKGLAGRQEGRGRRQGLGQEGCVRQGQKEVILSSDDVQGLLESKDTHRP